MAAVTVENLHKRYGAHEALRGVSFEIHEGEVFGLLGPNGAGKTTTVEILEGYRRRDEGDVQVLGADPVAPPRSWRGRIGVVLQSSAMYETLTVRERRIVATGTPKELTRTPKTQIRYRANGKDVVVETTEPTRALAELTAAAVARGEELEALEVLRASLEDVYLSLTHDAE